MLLEKIKIKRHLENIYGPGLADIFIEKGKPVIVAPMPSATLVPGIVFGLPFHMPVLVPIL